jgi:hypothetical protein
MTIAALDLGKKRIGIAISDHLGAGAYPVGIVERRSLTADLKQIELMLAARQVTQIVVGLPVNMDGTEGPALNFHFRSSCTTSGSPAARRRSAWVPARAANAANIRSTRSRPR